MVRRRVLPSLVLATWLLCGAAAVPTPAAEAPSVSDSCKVYSTCEECVKNLTCRYVTKESECDVAIFNGTDGACVPVAEAENCTKSNETSICPQVSADKSEAATTDPKAAAVLKDEGQNGNSTMDSSNSTETLTTNSIESTATPSPTPTEITESTTKGNDTTTDQSSSSSSQQSTSTGAAETTVDSNTTASTSSKDTPSPPSSSSQHRFDPPSFIGGIVLALGLLAIAYVGYKFYRARTEHNYHTL